MVVGQPKKRKRTPRPRTYDKSVLKGLKKVWYIFDFPCGKRFVSVLRTMLPILYKFKEVGTFFNIPLGNLSSMTEVFHRRVIALLVKRKLLDEQFACNLLSWEHSGFSIDNSVHIMDKQTQASLSEYIARPPISLKKIRYEPFKGRVLFHTTYSEYFKENVPSRR